MSVPSARKLLDLLSVQRNILEQFVEENVPFDPQNLLSVARKFFVRLSSPFLPLLFLHVAALSAFPPVALPAAVRR